MQNATIQLGRQTGHRGLCSVSVIPGFSYQPLKAQRRIKAQKRLFKKEEEIHGAVAK